MEIVLILVVLGLLMLLLLTLYPFLKWVFRIKARAIGVSLSILTVLVGFMIYQLFFIKLEFIQSKIYPDLYLVKNMPEERSILNQAMKDFVIKRIKTQAKKQPLYVNFSLRLYKYSNSYNPLVFGDSGTAYFIDNKEDFEGIIVENLDMYRHQKLAVLDKPMCEDKTHYCTKLHFFEQGKLVETDMIDITHEK